MKILIIYQMFENNKQKNPKIFIILLFFVQIKQKRKKTLCKKDPVYFNYVLN